MAALEAQRVHFPVPSGDHARAGSGRRTGAAQVLGRAGSASRYLPVRYLFASASCVMPNSSRVIGSSDTGPTSGSQPRLGRRTGAPSSRDR